MLSNWFLSIVLGAAIGLSLGALGGGGSILTVPALVYVLNVNAKVATGASLLIVGSSALFGTFAHHRFRRVQWKVGLSIGAISIVGSVAGTRLNKMIDPNLLLLLFAMLMFTVAIMMVVRSRKSPPSPVANTSAQNSLEFATGARTGSDLPLVDPSPRAGVVEVRPRQYRPGLVIAVGVGVGFLTGFLGVGGGFIVVPSLILALGFELPEAVGTSLLIIFVSSAFALAERGGVHGISDAIVVPFAVAAMLSAVVGNALANRLPIRKLNYGFIALVTSVAIYVSIRSILALT
ncbi:MAG: sulfite exporter TauE/SafE family protein [Acidobacteria bacterium]|nr:sulfite exporter TauE/SafE family protein [Acidobacteriota bacterium]